jgi:hypothetical protein
VKKHIIWLGVCLFCLYLSSNAQTDTILQRIVLVGDGGELNKDMRHPVVEAIRKTVKMDKKTTVLFLGDNLYQTGLPDNESQLFAAAKAVLDSQLSVADGSPARIVMIPGNHDWKNGARDGYETIIREGVYVDLLGKDNVRFEPKDGCPGPVAITLVDSAITLLVFDSQWWLHPYEKPEIESDCTCKTSEEVISLMEDILAKNSKNLVILAGHHPFKSNSVHGGFFPPKTHIFPFTDMSPNLYIPLPVLGSIYPIVRSVFGTPQDLRHPAYVKMITDITNAVKTHPNVIFAAGHDHGLQLIKDSSYNYIISGGGCKINRVSQSKRAPYAASSLGFAVLEVSTNKNVSVMFYEVGDSIKPAYSSFLLNFSKINEPTADTSKREVDIANIKYRDTITISASVHYPVVHGFRKFIVGQNYRPEWSTPVNMKVFNINIEKGGFKTLSFGGGKQTKSLRLLDKNGKEWVLRAVDKNPTKALPENFRNTLAQDMVQEFNSAAHPYAPLAIPGLARALDVTVATPQLYFVPDDPALGFYRPLFRNTVCLLEERDPTLDGSESRSTAKVFNKMLDENDHRPEQFKVLKARLLDILIGDFDRHFDQWKWATTDTGKGRLYYPIPRDRDQAFFYSDGAILKLASKNLLRFLKGFQYDILDVNWLGYSAKDFDRLFLTDLDAGEWKKTIEEVQTALDDTTIRNSVQKLPPEIYAINGETIIKKLISRREQLGTAGMEYHNFLSKYVNVLGSNKKEYFKVTSNGDGLQVRVYARQKGNDTSFIMFDRVFDPRVTREVRLYGLNKEDVFEVDENASSKIKLRIIGGRDNDTFNIKGHVTTLLYDIKNEGNYIAPGSHGKNRFSLDPPVNAYSIIGFNYDQTKFPQLQFGFNSDDGLIFGAGFTRITHGFRSTPYATMQRFYGVYSLTRNSYRFNYQGEFNHITRNADLVLHADFRYPALNNFFGLGNNTNKDPKRKYYFYRARYQTLELEALLRHRYAEKFHVSFGPYFFYYYSKFRDNTDRILGHPSLLGLDSANIFSKKSYLGGKLLMTIDNRNNLIFPTRGVLWNNELVSTRGMNNGSKNYTRFTSDMTIYASLSDPAKLVAVVGLGGGRIYSKNYEYFQALTLGAGQSNIHGFRKNRFAGHGSLYGSMELRLRLGEIKSYFLPGPFGLTGFYDIGRVWYRGEQSRRWHNAFGGGFYFVPFNLFLVSASVGIAGNEKLLNISLGTKVNLTY